MRWPDGAEGVHCSSKRASKYVKQASARQFANKDGETVTKPVPDRILYVASIAASVAGEVVSRGRADGQSEERCQRSPVETCPFEHACLSDDASIRKNFSFSVNAK